MPIGFWQDQDFQQLLQRHPEICDARAMETEFLDEAVHSAMLIGVLKRRTSFPPQPIEWSKATLERKPMPEIDWQNLLWRTRFFRQR